MVRTGTLLIVMAAVLAGCGEQDEGQTAVGPAPRPPGTYRLDVEDWLRRAEPSAETTRWSDLVNQATGADPVVDPAGRLGRGGTRPARPPPLDSMTDAERRAFRERALEYLRSEAEALREELVLAADGSFVWSHASRAAEGGSIALGLNHARTSECSWALDGDSLRLTTRRSGVPGGGSWQVVVEIRGRVRPDGAIEIDGSRDGLRGQTSVYRPEQVNGR